MIFNSPQRTFEVFEEIKKYEPTELYISADGPRNSEENIVCMHLRQQIISKINWSCNLQTNFYDTNLGCAEAVSSGITWFFENVEEGIILEDDCKPLPSFFTFCEKMLDLHRDDEDVMHISGSNFINLTNLKNRTYLFAFVPNIWGWATWRRAWQKYSLHLEKFSLKEFIENPRLKLLPQFLQDNTIYRYKFVKKYPTYTWDYQWTLTIFYFNGLCIYPVTNIVQNIGFDGNATNTFAEPENYKGVKTKDNITEIVKRKPILDEDFMEQLIQNNVDISLMGKLKKQLWLYSPVLMKKIIKIKVRVTSYFGNAT